MVRAFRLTLAGAVLAVTACGLTPTEPPSRRPVAVPKAASADSIDLNPDGTCRSGYSVTNGRCVLIT